MRQVDKMLYLKPPKGIDVLYLPLAAAERFGARPLVHQAQILPVSSTEQEDGLPGFVVSGVCLAVDDRRGPIPEMRILLSGVFEAIRDFNRHNTVPLQRIGFWAYNLLAGLTPFQLKSLLAEIVPELNYDGSPTKNKGG
jgi:hypothetical protein